MNVRPERIGFRRSGAAGLVACLWLVCFVASAQTVSDTPPSATSATSATKDNQPYRAAVDLGFKEFELGNYAESQVHFLKAAAMDRNARVLRALGMVSYELRNYAECIAYLSEALQSTNRPLTENTRAEAESLRNRARGYVARYTIVTRPANAELHLDDAPLALDTDQSVLLRVGPHHIEARAYNYRPSRRELLVVGGEDKSIQFDLEPMAATQTQIKANANVDESPSVWSSPWLWIGAGVVAVGAGVLLGLVLQPRATSVIDNPLTTSQSPGVVIRALGRP